MLRRALALLVAGGATAGIAALVFGGSEREGGLPPGPGGVPKPVRSVVGGLSTEEKVDQVLALGFEGTGPSAGIFATLERQPPGAVFVGSANWIDAGQGAALIARIRAGEARGIPPLIIAAQEGGPLRSLPDLPPATAQAEIGASGSPELARGWAQEAGLALSDVGFDLNLAPIADVAPVGTPVADRAFGDDPEIAAQMTAAAVQGCIEGGIACAPAHFPGMGAASADTDIGPATVGVDAATLLSRDLLPFEAAFDAGAPAVVVGHAFYAAHDPVTPASQSRRILDELLRRRLRFAGVAITDDLEAGAVRALTSVGEAAVASLAAGADLLLIEEPGVGQQRARELLLEAVRSGEIPEERLDEAAGRVLELKRELALLGD